MLKLYWLVDARNPFVKTNYTAIMLELIFHWFISIAIFWSSDEIQYKIKIIQVFLTQGQYLPVALKWKFGVVILWVLLSLAQDEKYRTPNRKWNHQK